MSILYMTTGFEYLDFVGSFVFAITGASIAAKEKFDFFGMLFLAFLTAVGGGTVRDLIIQSQAFWTINPAYLYLIFLATLSTFFLKSFYERSAKFLFFLDTLGLGTFAVIGTHKTLSMWFNLETSLVMGTVSAVLGGILRSAFSKEHSILINRELYATIAALVSLVYIGLVKLEVSSLLCASLSIMTAYLVRYLAIKFRIKMPSLEN